MRLAEVQIGSMFTAIALPILLHPPKLPLHQVQRNIHPLQLLFNLRQPAQEQESVALPTVPITQTEMRHMPTFSRVTTRSLGDMTGDIHLMVLTHLLSCMLCSYF